MRTLNAVCAELNRQDEQLRLYEKVVSERDALRAEVALLQMQIESIERQPESTPPDEDGAQEKDTPKPDEKEMREKHLREFLDMIAKHTRKKVKDDKAANVRDVLHKVFDKKFTNIAEAINEIESKEEYEEKKAELSSEEEKVAEQLAPIFFGDRQEAEKFLARIKGMKPKDVTATVNELVGKRIISDASCNRTLWKILHDNGLYKPTEQNWNDQIDRKRK